MSEWVDDDQPCENHNARQSLNNLGGWPVPDRPPTTITEVCEFRAAPSDWDAAIKKALGCRSSSRHER